MTTEIDLRIAGLEHMTKQPPDRRYALFCEPVLKGAYGVSCETESRGGHIGDYEKYAQAKEFGVNHLHPVLIKFYPTLDRSNSSDAFLEDLKHLSPDHRVF